MLGVVELAQHQHITYLLQTLIPARMVGVVELAQHQHRTYLLQTPLPAGWLGRGASNVSIEYTFKCWHCKLHDVKCNLTCIVGLSGFIRRK